MYAKTTFPEFSGAFRIHHDQALYACGSCFANTLADQLARLKFQLIRHPFGIAFNPLVMAGQLERMLSRKTYSESELILQDGLYHSLDHHGSYSHPDPAVTLDHIGMQLEQGYIGLSGASVLVITLGSAHYYRLKRDGRIAANCHKIPQNEFQKSRATVEDMTIALRNAFQSLRTLNPQIRILMSVSPVRYLRDGFEENARSKAALLLTIDQLQSELDYVHYFPAYEIFMDDLRDYRYTAEDLVHPSPAAVEYIWKYFERAYFEEDTQTCVNMIRGLQQLLHHRIMHPGSEAFKLYLASLNQRLQEIQKAFPKLDVQEEAERIRALRLSAG
ncbi:MAG TPA: GSCFA domain-containing protein [Saprospiraceae bacterium]|nr:GSCFA domain-containing protein [Saprospiraceae bacterium]